MSIGATETGAAAIGEGLALSPIADGGGTALGEASYGEAAAGGEFFVVDTTPPQPLTYADVVLADTPLVYYRLGETDMANPNVMHDSSGNGRDGVFSGTGTGGLPALITDTDTAALSRPSSGVGSVPNAAWMNPTYMTHEVWAKPNTVSGTHIVGGRTNLGSYGEYDAYQMFLVQVGNRWGMTVRGAGNPADLYESVGSIQVDKVAHLVGTYDGVWGRLYVDGVLVGSVAVATALRAITMPLYIGGCAFPGYGFGGVLDEYAIYDQALAPERVAAHYAAGTAVSAPDPITVAAGLAVEGEVALPTTVVVAGAPGVVVATGVAVEADGAPSSQLLLGTRVVVGTAVETDATVGAPTVVGTRVAAGIAIEGEVALAVTVLVGASYGFGSALETDQVPPTSTSTGAVIPLGVAIEGEVVLPAVTRVSVRVLVEPAVEQDTSGAVTVLVAALVLAGVATELAEAPASLVYVDMSHAAVYLRDDDTLGTARLLGWWDGSQLVAVERIGWWDGEQIRSLEQL